MAQASRIEWTDATWNPVTGCSKISPGCKNCYAERMAHRLHAMGVPAYRNGFRVTLQDHVLDVPLHWKKPRRIFVNSMSDLFHEDVPLEFIERVFDVMHLTPQHTYQVLTKRASRLAEIAATLPCPSNAWMGVSVETADFYYRIDHLRRVAAAVRFLSLEPLLGPLASMDLSGIDWVIVGGESGPHARPVQRQWVVDIRDQCREAEVPFFFKQWGGTRKHRTGRVLDGHTYDEMPGERSDMRAIPS